MAGYRQIHTQMWKDEWFIELEPDEKFLFIYMFSNELSSISGLYKIPVRVIHNETGIAIGRIEKIISKFVSDGKIEYGDGTLWVRNMWRYHKNASARTQIKVWDDINSIPDCAVKHNCIQYLYGIGMDTLDVLKAKAKAKADHSKNENENGNESESEADVDSPDLFSQTQRMIESVIGISPVGEAGIKAVTEIAGMGATMEDIQAGYQWLKENRGDGKPIQYCSSLVGPIRTAITQRVQKQNTKNKERELLKGYTHA